MRRKIKGAASHLKECLKELERLELVRRERRGHHCYLCLTDKGQRIVEHIRKILQEGRAEKVAPAFVELPGA